MPDELVRRTNGGIEWREPATLSNRGPQFGPVAVAESKPAPPRGVRTAVQSFRAIDGTTQRRDLPVQTEPGEWRETVENGRRLLSFARADGSRSVICVD